MKYLKRYLPWVLFLFVYFGGLNAAYSQSYSVSLSLINEVRLPSEPVDLYISDGFAYIIGSSGNSGVVMIANANDPEHTGYLSYDRIAENPTLIAVNGHYAYIAERSKAIRIVKFENIYNPKPQGSFDAISEVRKMVIVGGYLYYLRKDFGLQIYDISFPTVPIFKGTQLVVGDANGLFVNNKYAYVTSNTGNLTIIDITNMSNLPIAGNYNSGINFFDVFVSDKYAYIPQGITGVQVLDVSSLPSPKWIANIYSKKSSTQVIVSGDYTLVNDQSTLQVFYNKDPKNQLYAGSFDNMGATINRIDIVNGKYIFLCSSNNKLKVLQMSYNY